MKSRCCFVGLVAGWCVVLTIASCPWTSGPTDTPDKVQCADGSFVLDYSCEQGGHGQRIKCPPNLPTMCELNETQACGGGLEHCCTLAPEYCHQGERPCGFEGRIARIGGAFGGVWDRPLSPVPGVPHYFRSMVTSGSSTDGIDLEVHLIEPGFNGFRHVAEEKVRLYDSFAVFLSGSLVFHHEQAGETINVTAGDALFISRFATYTMHHGYGEADLASDRPVVCTFLVFQRRRGEGPQLPSENTMELFAGAARARVEVPSLGADWYYRRVVATSNPGASQQMTLFATLAGSSIRGSPPSHRSAGATAFSTQYVVVVNGDPPVLTSSGGESFSMRPGDAVVVEPGSEVVTDLRRTGLVLLIGAVAGQPHREWVCPWVAGPTETSNKTLCADGTYVFDHMCAVGGHGPTVRCPHGSDVMCAWNESEACGGGADYCCAASASACPSGARPCQSWPNLPNSKWAYPGNMGQRYRDQQSESISRVAVMLGWYASIVCGRRFVSGRPASDIFSSEFQTGSWDDVAASAKATDLNITIDDVGKRVICSATSAGGLPLSLMARHSSRSFGCVWPSIYAGVDPTGTAQAAIDSLRISQGTFVEAASSAPEALLDFSRAIFASNESVALLVYEAGYLVHEEYGTSSVQTMDRDMPWYGMGLAKSIAAILPGIREMEGAMSLHDLAHCPELTAMERSRWNLTVWNLMSMRGGRPLAAEDQQYQLNSDVKKMLHSTVYDMANFATMASASYPPGVTPEEGGQQEFYYSSGQTAVHSRELRYTFPDTLAGQQEYSVYPWSHLFARIQAPSFVYEADAVGTFVAASSAWASARDWLKLGVLMLQQGDWDGQSVVPADHVSEIVRPWALSSSSFYGAGWWPLGELLQEAHPGSPSWYMGLGTWGQYVLVCPALEIVIVRLGTSYMNSPFPALADAFLQAVLASNATTIARPPVVDGAVRCTGVLSQALLLVACLTWAFAMWV